MKESLFLSAVGVVPTPSSTMGTVQPRIINDTPHTSGPPESASRTTSTPSPHTSTAAVPKLLGRDPPDALRKAEALRQAGVLLESPT